MPDLTVLTATPYQWVSRYRKTFTAATGGYGSSRRIRTRNP